MTTRIAGSGALVPDVDARLVSIEQAAAVLGIGRSALYELLQQGAIASCQIGRRRLIAVSELDAYVDRLRAGV